MTNDIRADPRRFDHLPVVYDRYATLVGRPLRTYLAARLPRTGGRRAVDLGAGTGQHSTLLADYYGEVLAVDISQPMLTHALAERARPNVDYQCRDLRDVTADRDGRFDLVFSAYTLHHVQADLDEALAGIRRLLAPGGQAILVDNVDARRRVPRSWFVKEAVRGLAGDVLHHRRPLPDAVEVFRLSVHPGWLDHLTSDEFLPPDEFAHRLLAVFPDAGITRLYRARAVHWLEPGA
jgi:SAM-dependent methyltransferase